MLHDMDQSIFRLQTFSEITPAARKDKHQPFLSRLPDAKVQLPLVHIRIHILPNAICAHMHTCERAACYAAKQRTPHTRTQTHVTSYAACVHFVQKLIIAAEHVDRGLKSHSQLC